MKRLTHLPVFITLFDQGIGDIDREKPLFTFARW